MLNIESLLKKLVNFMQRNQDEDEITSTDAATEKVSEILNGMKIYQTSDGGVELIILDQVWAVYIIIDNLGNVRNFDINVNHKPTFQDINSNRADLGWNFEVLSK